MDDWTKYCLAKAQWDLMIENNPHHDVKAMVAKGLCLMVVGQKLIWAQRDATGKKQAYMIKTKNAAGADQWTTVPVECAYVGIGNNPFLTSTGTMRSPNSFPLEPQHMSQMEGDRDVFVNWDPSIPVDPMDPKAGFNRSDFKRGLSICASPEDEFGQWALLHTILGKSGGLFLEALADHAANDRPFLSMYFKNIAEKYDESNKSAIYRAVLDILEGPNNGYHTSYHRLKENMETLSVHTNATFEYLKEKRDEVTKKLILPDNSSYLQGGFDATGDLKRIFGRFPKANYMKLKILDETGSEIGYGSGDQQKLHSLGKSILFAAIFHIKFYGTTNKSTLLHAGVDFDHSGIKILYRGDSPTPSEIATFKECERTGEGPPRNQVNLAVTADMTKVAELANSDAMKAERELFYAKRNSQLSLTASDEPLAKKPRVE
jgi:hypothetical protein